MERAMITLVFLCTVWSNVEAISVSIPKNAYDVARGGNATIPCTFTTTKNPTSCIITWSRRPSQPDAEDVVILTHYCPANTFDLSDQFDPKRFSAETNVQAGQSNLLLKSLMLDDSMIYECRVQIPGDAQGKTSAITKLVVLVAPTKPICNVQGKTEYGQNINLTCVSEEASPDPTYTWQTYDVQNNPRPLDPKSTIKGGILSLFNVTKDTSGYYVCTSTNKVGSASTNFTLSIMPPSMNIGSTAGIIGGVAAFLILLVIIICCCCRRKKKQEEDHAMGAVEYTDKEPEVNEENRQPDGEESSRGYSDSKGPVDRRDQYEEKRERNVDRRREFDDRRSNFDDRRSDVDDRRSNFDDRRSDFDDRRSDFDDRRSDFNDRRSDFNDRRRDYDDRRRDYDDRRRDYDDRRSDYDDRRSDFDDQQSNYSDRRDKYSDRNERYDDDRRYDDERRYDDRRGQR